LQAAGLDVREIGRRLRVSTLLEGSVRKSGDRLRVGVQLTDAENGYHLWSEIYDREMSDIFAIQEQIAYRVAHELEVTLTAREKAALGKAPTQDIQAYDCYLRGRKFYYQYSTRDVECAIQLFAAAIERDPDYPAAYAGLADCWSYLYLYAERSDAIRDQADWASRRAVELDPESGPAQASRALALSLRGRDEEAEQAFDMAARLDPNLFEACYFHARHCFVHGQLEKAASLYEEAMRVRPEDHQSPLLVAQIYDDLGRHEDARAARLRGIVLAEEHLKLNPDDARAVYMAANGMAALGQRERGREWAGRALAMRPEDGMMLYNVGCIYALLGCPEDAIATLEKAVRCGLRQKGWYEHDSNLDPLRGDPRFQALLASLD
jgi:tetratricopeptide (TPR) repeat protein